MAQNLKMIPLVLLVLQPLISTSSLADHRANDPLKETKMSFFFHDYTAGPNTTSVPTAGIAGKLWSYTQFGTLIVTDDPITETPDPKAAPIGRCQGIDVTAELHGRNAHIMMSLVFTRKQYKGSTLELQGNSRQFERVREVSVVSGTGKFRFARGYATFETYFVDISKGYGVIRCNVTVRHY